MPVYIGRYTTKVPQPCRVTSKPSSPRTRTALTTVARMTPMRRNRLGNARDLIAARPLRGLDLAPDLSGQPLAGKLG